MGLWSLLHQLLLGGLRSLKRLICIAALRVRIPEACLLCSTYANVNKSLKRKLNDDIKALGGDEAVDIGTLNIVHNTFIAGFTAANMEYF